MTDVSHLNPGHGVARPGRADPVTDERHQEDDDEGGGGHAGGQHDEGRGHEFLDRDDGRLGLDDVDLVDHGVVDNVSHVV